MALQGLEQVDVELVAVCRRLFGSNEFWKDWVQGTAEYNIMELSKRRTDVLVAMWQRLGWEFEIEGFFAGEGFGG